MTRDQLLLQALGFFKDWSNFMLVTTTVAMGWVAKASPDMKFRVPAIFCFGLSIIFAVFTLALIPLVAEQITAKSTSIYDISATFKPFWLWGEARAISLKVVCWPQHVLFISGILLYGLGSSLTSTKSSGAAEPSADDA